ncbi:MAG: protein kinase [Lentisphaeria bacterium]|nr:protein kinase [Lentisphaeria bacterium]
MSYELRCQFCASRMEVDPMYIGQDMACPHCNEVFKVPPTSITAGMVEGDYWVQKHFATGDLGEVFYAKRSSTNEKLFLKVISPAISAGRESQVQQYIANIESFRQIQHPQLVAAVDSGIINDQFFIAYPFSEGKFLDTQIEAKGAYSPKSAVKIAIKVAMLLNDIYETYQTAHNALKPGNIQLESQGAIRLYDFGGAKRFITMGAGQLPSIRQKSTIADYMAPELSHDDRIGNCFSDMYSLGGILFYMVRGFKPYEGSDTTQILQKHLLEPTPHTDSNSFNGQAEFDEIIATLMAKDPSKRYRSWEECIEALKGLLLALGSHSQTNLNVHDGLSATQLSMASKDLEAKKNDKIIVLLLGIIVLCLILFLAVFLFIGGGDDEEKVVDKKNKPKVEQTSKASNGTSKSQTSTKEAKEDDIVIGKIIEYEKWASQNPSKTTITKKKFESLLKKYPNTIHAQRIRDNLEMYAVEPIREEVKPEPKKEQLKVPVDSAVLDQISTIETWAKENPEKKIITRLKFQRLLRENPNTPYKSRIEENIRKFSD